MLNLAFGESSSPWPPWLGWSVVVFAESEAMSEARSEPRTELEMQQAAAILRKHWVNAKKRCDPHPATGVACALSALAWALGEDDEFAAAFEEMIDGTREDLREAAGRN